VIHYDKNIGGNTRLNITNKKTLLTNSIYFGRLCHPQEYMEQFNVLLRMAWSAAIE
jgi:hypothetical protein